MPFLPIYKHPSLEVAVSPEDYDYLRRFRWTLSKGYARRWTGGGYISMEWDVARRMGLPPALEYDHLDRCPLNNTRGNLAVSDRFANNRNRTFFSTKKLLLTLSTYVPTS